MNECTQIEIISQELVNKEYIEYGKSQVKLKLLDEVKDILFSNKYFIVKAQVRTSNLVNPHAADLYIKGELMIEELTLESFCKIIQLV